MKNALCHAPILGRASLRWVAVVPFAVPGARPRLVVRLLPVSSVRVFPQAAACGWLARRRIECMGGTSQREPKDLLEPAKILAVLPSEKWGVTLRGVKPGQPVDAFRAKAISLGSFPRRRVRA